jgi:hypothetical protein
MMLPLTTISSISTDALISTTRTLLYVARIDGMHPAEEQLIRTFYESCAEGLELPAFDNLPQQTSSHIDAHLFANDGEREMLFALCTMTAYADGHLSHAEQEALSAIAAELHLTPERVNTMTALLKDYMLAQLSHLPDAASVAKVAQELG